MIKAKHHFFLDPFFRYYAKWKTKRCFHEVKTIGDLSLGNLPVLLIVNHMSWWDGLWMSNLNMDYFKRKFHFMMLEDQLEKNWFFKYTGGFSVKKGSRSVVETINYSVELLKNPDNLVLIFPQGKIQSHYTHKFIFEKGIETILKRVNVPIQVIFVANLIEYMERSKPTLYTYVEEFKWTQSNISEIEERYNRFYELSLSKNLQLKTA